MSASQAVEDGRFPVVYWKKRFDIRHPSPNPVIAILDTEYNELVKAWKRLQELLPLADQVLFQERPQTVQDVQALVRDIQDLWVSRSQQVVFTRSMTLSDTFSATLDSHTIPLTALPSHQFYSSLLYSALQSIIKASAKYPRVICGVMNALVKINRSICPSAESELVQPTKDSIPSIAKFYSLTFFFLGELMDWYTRRFKCRLLKSLHEDIDLDFCSLISMIQGSANRFMHGPIDPAGISENDSEKPEAVMQHTDQQLWEKARLSQLGQRLDDRRSAAQTAMTRLLIWEIQRDAEQRSRLRDKRCVLLSQLLGTAHQRLRPVIQDSRGIVSLTTAPGQDLLLSATPVEAPRHKHTRVELQLASAHLQDYFDDDDQTADYEPDMDVMVEAGVLELLKQWATDTYSQILAVGDSPNPGLPSPVSVISACYATLARDARFPLIAHFCALASTARNGMTLFQQGLIALVYSLIRQLIEYLPPVANGTSSRTVKPENLTRLDGTLTSWKEVLSLIDALLYYAPPLLMCIVDGLDKLQDPSTDEYIRSLMRVFVSHTRKPSGSIPGRPSVLLKVLFTVDGRLDPLVETLSESPLTLSESNGTAVAAPGTPSGSDIEVMIDT
ncbi:hypothetical protein BDW59DRAFT_45259 [Aspergillus cavernicola]|uniref:DUF7708 domain-containing protein n=1 Tax=Aspergillus cavernicola TaxID=176166 RepID=A0ABR4J2N9_9EURO